MFQRWLPRTSTGGSQFFPPVSSSRRGLVLVGGELSTEWLLDAYTHGIFPWPVQEGVENLGWFCPERRGILELDALHVSRRLARTCRSGKFEVTCDWDFAGVIRSCATVGDRPLNNWITTGIIEAYERLHREGYAHSVEVWHGGELAGGVYGVALGGLFAGESMFYRVRDASKVALFHLVEHLRARGYSLFDTQTVTPHTLSLGAREISRHEYLRRLNSALAQEVSFGERLESTATS